VNLCLDKWLNTVHKHSYAPVETFHPKQRTIRVLRALKPPRPQGKGAALYLQEQTPHDCVQS
jgi:hypothetical protein